MVTILITCNAVGFKTILIFGYRFAASGLFFPISFLIACVITEVYGYALAGRMIWIQLTCTVLFVSAVNILVMPNHQLSTGLDQAYFQIYHSIWKIMTSSIISIPLAYFASNWVMSHFKLNTFTMSLFPRYILANAVGKFIIVVISYPINFGHIYTTHTIIKLIFDTWLFKMAAAILLSPLACLLIKKVKRIERLDTFDYGVSYNPTRVFNDRELGENHYYEK